MINTPPRNSQSDSVGVFFLNHKNSASGTGGVGTVTREMLKNYPGINYIYSDLSSQDISKDTEYNLRLSEKEFSFLHGSYTKLYLWPLFHCLKSGLTDPEVKPARNSYAETVIKYADLAVAFAQKKYPSSQRFYWINDYVLIGSIKRIRTLDPCAVIVFSLRTSFGTSTIKPHLKKDDVALMKENLSAANFITVHRKSDKSNITELLGNARLKIEVVPMGNNKKYRQSLLETAVSSEISTHLRQKFPNMKILSSISRFEMSKGIDYELSLVNTLLETYPKIRGKFVFIRYSYISEQKRKMDHYLAYQELVNKKVQLINEQFGSESWKPIVSNLNYKLNDSEVSGILCASDMLLIASYADGFNHLTLEYIYSRKREKARLLVSDIGARDYLSGIDPITHNEEADAAILFNAITDGEFSNIMRSILLKRSANKLSANKWVATILKKMMAQKERIL